MQSHTLFSSVCKLDPTDAEAWTKLSLVEKRLGKYQKAEYSARRALLVNPKLGYAHFALGQALHSLAQRHAAIDCYRSAIHYLPSFPDSYFLLGLALREQGEMSGALASLEQALRIRPSFAQALAEVRATHIDLGSLETGLHYLRRAATLNPLDAVALGNIAHALRLQGESLKAVEEFRSALGLDPENVDLIAGLATTLEFLGRAEEAATLVAQGIQIEPDHAVCHLVFARLDRREKRLQQAVDRLQSLLTPHMPTSLRADVLLEIGQMYDQMGDAERAYPMIVEGKRQKSLATRTSESDKETLAYIARLRQVRQFATPALAKVLHARKNVKAMAPVGALPPVFLIGFPRSGTTLMEQVLDSHPQIQAMEEKPTVSLVANHALALLEKHQCALSDLNDAQLAELRQMYFAEVSKYIHLQPGNQLIDKMPLNTILLPIIATVFPDAKFISAVRHPCDVSLSCLMQNFASNAGMSNFFTLNDTVQFYAEVMNTWSHCESTLPLDFHVVRYEDLISDLPAVSMKLLDFLGQPWDAAVLMHTEHAQQRGAINTPSYHQVIQPVYLKSRYRWKRYERDLIEVLPVLQPFIDKFGYA